MLLGAGLGPAFGMCGSPLPVCLTPREMQQRLHAGSPQTRGRQLAPDRSHTQESLHTDKRGEAESSLGRAIREEAGLAGRTVIS